MQNRRSLSDSDEELRAARQYHNDRPAMLAALRARHIENLDFLLEQFDNLEFVIEQFSIILRLSQPKISASSDAFQEHDGGIDVRWWIDKKERLVPRNPVLVQWVKKTGFKNLVPVPLKNFSEERFKEKHSKYLDQGSDDLSKQKRRAKSMKIETAIVAIRKLQDLIKKRNELKETLSKNALSLSQKAKFTKSFNQEHHARAIYEFNELEKNLNVIGIYLHLSETMEERFTNTYFRFE